MRKLLVLTGSLILGSAMAIASGPGTLNFQGQLTDPGGIPVADGSYLVRFNIYDDPVAGTSLWNSGFRGVVVANGLFQYELGDTTALPDTLFNGAGRWLGVQIGADPELAPRTEFNRVAYAFQAIQSENAFNSDSLGTQPASFYLHEGIDTIHSSWQLRTNDGGQAYSFTSNSRRFSVSKAGTGSAILESDSLTGGELTLTGGSGLGVIASGGGDGVNLEPRVSVLSAGNAAGGISLSGGTEYGELYIGDTSGLPSAILRGSNFFTTSDSLRDTRVFLGGGAVNQTEILDEPGIAASRTASNITWPLNPTISDILTVSITIPAAGYVVVEATAVLRFAASPSSRLAGQMQIDTDAGGSLQSSHTSWAGVASVPSSPLYQSGVARRVYFFSQAGTHTFRLEATQTTGDVGSSIQCINTWLQATYFRTGYGSVTTIAESPGDYPDARAISVQREDGTFKQAYEIDLRHLELQALKAQLDLERSEMRAYKAEADLRRARSAHDEN